MADWSRGRVRKVLEVLGVGGWGKGVGGSTSSAIGCRGGVAVRAVECGRVYCRDVCTCCVCACGMCGVHEGVCAGGEIERVSLVSSLCGGACKGVGVCGVARDSGSERETAGLGEPAASTRHTTEVGGQPS